MEKGVQEIRQAIELIKLALLGNQLGGDEGLVGEIKKIKTKQDSLEEEVKHLRDERVRNSVYIKIITWLLMILGTGIIGFILNTSLNKPQIQNQNNGNTTAIVK